MKIFNEVSKENYEMFLKEYSKNKKYFLDYIFEEGYNDEMVCDYETKVTISYVRYSSERGILGYFIKN
jgi:hypothetical protein